MGAEVPLATFKIQSIEKTSIFWFFFNISELRVIFEIEAKIKLIDGNCVLSCIVLQNTCQEGLREEES